MPARITATKSRHGVRRRFLQHWARWLLGTSLGAVLGAWSASAAESAPDLAQLSLSELMDVRVSSVSLRLQDLSSAPAAVTVLTSDDIRRSGADSIPDLLRLVPGVHVGQINQSMWSISSRGFGGRFSNKLLVLIDGRTAYSHSFSGTFWDTQDLVLEDVERIEVIRGPGASIWGSNAVNGVINITTKNAKDTTGALVTGIVGDDLELGVTARYGGKLSDNSYLRVFTKFTEYAGREGAPSGGTADAWDVGQVGFRLDADIADRNSLSLHGKYYGSNIGQSVNAPILTPPYTALTGFEESNDGFYLTGGWTRETAMSSMALQAYVSHNERAGSGADLSETVYDIEFRNAHSFGASKHLVWGLGYRRNEETLDSPGNFLFLDPRSKSSYLFSAFGQYEIAVFEDRLNFVIGARFENDEFTGSEFQPTARFVWSPTDRQTIWGAASRASRTPARADLDVVLNQAILPPMSLENPGSLPAVVRIFGNDTVDSEELVSFELGYRVALGDSTAVEISGFHNIYSDLQYHFISNAPFVEAMPEPLHLVIPFTRGAGIAAEAQGIEITADWVATDWLRFIGGYSYHELNVTSIPQDAVGSPTDIEHNTPHHMLSLAARATLSDHWEIDAILRVVGQMKTFEIDSYSAVDLRLGWRPRSTLELSIVGRNLFADSHAEYSSEYLGTVSTEVPTSVIGKIVWRH